MIFKSTSHQRFENGLPVRGLQVCNRTVQIEENINGYNGFKINPGDGYVVSIINNDGAHPLWGNNLQMAPKPMRIVEKGEGFVRLRGYKTLTQTPFGWETVDFSDYGIVLYEKNYKIEKCRLELFDRDVYIEYYK